ncbi:hypothetical protein HAX54_010065, partial [Datura stramonium]|nr:hypothetical protein [Datura stramonium]
MPNSASVSASTLSMEVVLTGLSDDGSDGPSLRRRFVKPTVTPRHEASTEQNTRWSVARLTGRHSYRQVLMLATTVGHFPDGHHFYSRSHDDRAMGHQE